MVETLQKKVDELNAENNKLKTELENSKSGFDVMLSQLDAHREQLNESLNVGLNLRTNVVHLKKQNQKLAQEMDNVKKQLADA